MKYINILDSDAINKEHQKLIDEISKLYIKLNDTINIQEEINNINNINERYLALAIDNFYKNIPDKKGVITIRATDITPEKNCFINKEFNYITKECIDKSNKLFNENYIPEDLVFEAVEDKEYKEVTDNSLSSTFENGKVWCRTILAEPNEKEVLTTLYVFFPSSISTDDVVNFIEFDLFPYESTEVVAIEWSREQNKKYLSTIDELKYHKGCIRNDHEIEASKTKNHITLSFEDKEISLLAITLKQKLSMTTDDGEKFCLGLKNLVVEKREYLTDSLEFSFPISIDNPDGIYINSIVPVYSGAEQPKPIISVYETTSSGDRLLYDKFIPFKTGFNDLKVKVVYPKTTNHIVVNKIEINYKL